MKVQVYFNLHRKVWSIKALEGENKNKVIGYAEKVILSDVKPKVSEAGRQRVLKEKKKNVHAGLIGNLVYTDIDLMFRKGTKEITYNPYCYNTFVYTNNEKEYTGSDYAYMTNKKVFVFN